MKFGTLFGIAIVLSIAGCGGGSVKGNGSTPPNSPLYSLSGTITNLSVNGLVVSNGADKIAVAKNTTTIAFPTLLPTGAPYQVLISRQPPGYAQQCGINKGSGVVNGSNVTNIAIECHTAEAVVTTLAGTGNSGAADGVSNQASFNFPQGVAVDAQGNTFVADTSNNCIRKISVAGLVTTFAGNGTLGFSDGMGKAASFRSPRGIAIDSEGNVFVADSGNSSIRKISPLGLVSTFAGNGIGGRSDGVGGAARFLGPQGIAVDTVGNVYVADTGNSLIRKITVNGTVTTIAGNGRQGISEGVGQSATIGYPYGIALDSSGNMFVTASDVVLKILPDGTVTTLAGSPGTEGSTDGIGKSAAFYTPVGIAVDSDGTLYVADDNNNRIRRIDQNTRVTTLAGGASGNSLDGIGGSSGFNHPAGIAINSQGTLFVSDSFSNVIRKIQPR
ncbi:NHL repeat-containing protein [Duganella qianjiadongensis]|uniref:NHL repeat-containing protein n=1 Tax=Duganella qianjiadongensis TaxID=2692176 RepID=A0ABW9VPD9_9BURK|nr:NHL repeat-containing protein [Duganella qianjiadongensis]MYM41434.1 hypothetical protein [Duganella qianjiadongensis]